MSKPWLLLPFLALAAPAAAQHTELVARAGANLFSFGGKDARGSSHVNYTQYNGVESGYTNSIYGKQPGLGLGLGGRALHVGKRGGLLAFDLGYDWLRSRTNVDVLDYYDGQTNRPLQADGRSYLKMHNLAGFLGLGYRFDLPAFDLDVLAGPEVAYVYGMHENGSGTFDGGRSWSTSQERTSRIGADARLRAEATAWFGRTGVQASYSQGFINYQGALIGASREVYSRTLRLGVAFRLK